MPDNPLANWPMKLLSLGLAFAIWVSVTGEMRIVQDFSVPVELALDEDKILASESPTTASIRLRGPESTMRRFDPVALAIQVNLESAAEGEQDVVLSTADLQGVPRGVDVASISPERIRVEIERRLIRELTVEPAFLGQPPEGFAFYGARVFPETLRVEGPATAVEPMTQA